MRFETVKKAVSPVAVAAALAAALTTAGTLAYLTDAEGVMANAFAIGNVDVSLEETDTTLDGDGDSLTNSYAMAEGSRLKQTIDKDPKVAVAAGSSECWLFVQVEEKNGFDGYLGYEAADGWAALDEELHPGVFYREVPASAEAQAFSVLRNDAVAVDADTTAEELRNLEAAGGPWPTLEIAAFAVQKSGVEDASVAWALIGGRNA